VNALFLRRSAWRDLAEHAAETLQKGMRDHQRQSPSPDRDVDPRQTAPAAGSGTSGSSDEPLFQPPQPPAIRAAHRFPGVRP
jgi:hypothetical protein